MPVSTVRVCRSLDELLDGASERQPMAKGAESLSGSAFERVVIDGDAYVLKHHHVDDDWIQRATGDLVSRPAVVYGQGLLDRLPASIDHTIAGVAVGLGRHGWGAAVLMRDVAPYLVPDDPSPIPVEQQKRFIDHMAELHAAFFGFRDTLGLCSLAASMACFHTTTGALEAARGGTDVVPTLLGPGWAATVADAPRAGRLAARLSADSSPLVAALAATPTTLVHGDWKAGNLGSHPDGRTILIDWAFPGERPPCADLAWYLAVNCDRMSDSKDATIGGYRQRLEAHGVDTDGWFEQQMELSLIVAFVQLGWSKGGDELAWWDDRVSRAARLLP